tara:strand:- start:1740 stop:3326 length:1587 start_codon:yes stop_codon:yes gene_type:complete
MSQEDLILDRSNDIPQAMSIASDVLEGVIVNQKNARFVLPNTGILSRDSVFQFKLLANGSFLPLNAGIYSLINRVDLMIGQQTIQSINSLGLYKAITKSYDTPSYRNNYTRLMNGINTTMSPVPMNVVLPYNGTNSQTGLLQPTGVATSNVNPTIQTMAYDMILTNDPATTPSWSVKIGDLFPMLSDGGLELPLFLINSPVSIVFTFNEQPSTATDSLSKNSVGTLACINYTGIDTPDTSAHGGVRLITEELLLFADYLYYTDERMFQVEESMNDEKGMSMIYTDLIQVVNAQPALAPTPGAGNLGNVNFNFQVPVSNYQVKNLFICWNPNGDLNASGSDPTSRHPANQAFSNAVFGKYAMMNSVKPYNIQCRVNDELVFPQPLVNDPLKAQESGYVYGSPVQIHTGMYSRNGTTTETGVYSQSASYYPESANGANNKYNFCGGMNLRNMMTNNFHFLGINLSTLYGDSNRDAELISQKPIEITGQFPVNDTTNINYNNYVFCEITKLFSLKAGNVVIRDGVNQLQRQ